MRRSYNLLPGTDLSKREISIEASAFLARSLPKGFGDIVLRCDLGDDTGKGLCSFCTDVMIPPVGSLALPYSIFAWAIRAPLWLVRARGMDCVHLVKIAFGVNTNLYASQELRSYCPTKTYLIFIARHLSQSPSPVTHIQT